MSMKMEYKVNDRPPLGKAILFAFQQLLAILAATIAVPAAINSNPDLAGVLPGMSQSAALFGAGVGTLVYLLFTKFKSPVFLGSSFAFIGSMVAAFAGAITVSVGYLGLILGAVFAGLVYVILGLIVKLVGSNWINKLMPPIIIGPTVAIIGLSLAKNAIGDMTKGAVPTASVWLCLLCGLTTLLVTIICSVHGKKTIKTIPFIIGIASGYVLASIFTVIGHLSGNDSFLIINFSLFKSLNWLPEFAFIKAFTAFKEFSSASQFFSYLGTILLAYVPVAFVTFAEHIADHKNLSSIIDQDLLTNPGLDRTLLGDGVGSMAGAFFGGCPNTTYGESVGTVAISGNASIITIVIASIMAIVASFLAPFVTLLETIPNCVMGGICVALYGFISVSGLKMIQNVDLNDNKNLFVVSSILIAGVGGLTLTFAGAITITPIACALLLGILVNIIVHLSFGKKKDDDKK